jgi:GTP-binding protein
VVIDVDDEHAGTVVEKMAQRKGEMTDMRPSGGGKTRVTFTAPSRGLIGYHGEFLSDTRGTGIMNRLFEKYGPYKGPIQGRQNGVLISMEQGEAVPYALNALEERGVLFISPGEKLYEGMVIGENAKPQDLEVNPLKSKQLTNFRSTGKDDAVRLTPPRRMTLEQAIAYIQDDELVEVTPQSIRLRKRYLDPHERKKASRKEGDPSVASYFCSSSPRRRGPRAQNGRVASPLDLNRTPPPPALNPMAARVLPGANPMVARILGAGLWNRQDMGASGWAPPAREDRRRPT